MTWPCITMLQSVVRTSCCPGRPPWTSCRGTWTSRPTGGRWPCCPAAVCVHSRLPCGPPQSSAVRHSYSAAPSPGPGRKHSEGVMETLLVCSFPFLIKPYKDKILESFIFSFSSTITSHFKPHSGTHCTHMQTHTIVELFIPSLWYLEGCSESGVHRASPVPPTT